MGKQGYDQRAALANALNTSGVAKMPPPKKETPKEPPPVTAGKGQGKRRKQQAEEPEQRTKAEIEAARIRALEEKEQEKEQFYAAEAAKKLQERRGADAAVTYVEDKDTRKPKAVSDISDYWKANLGFLPFMPSDNIAPAEASDAVDPQDRLEYLQMLNEQLSKLLRLRFHVFWSQVIYDEKVRRCLDSYLRFCLRNHDVPEGDLDAASNANTAGGEDLVAAEEKKVTREISRRVLLVYVRLSRPQETSHDFISEGKWAQLIYEHSIFDVPKLIDICAIYGDSNRIQVTKIVHSVFTLQPIYKDEFESVVQHMLSGLHQCCEPLRQAANAKKGKKPPAELSVEECLAFLPDILSCFNAIFCFFPEDCVERLLSGKLSVPSSATDSEDSTPAIPLADLMVLLHDALMEMQQKNDGETDPVLGTIVKLLSRLLGLVLGFRMAPRRGAAAFEELLDWVRAQSDRALLLYDLGKYGLETTAMEWLASGLVDDAQLDYLEQFCGPVLPAGERKRGRRPAPAAVPSSGAAAGPGGGGAASSTAGRVPVEASASDAAKIREVKEVVGSGYGDGFLLQCLLHYGGSVPAVVGAVFDGSLPPHIKALPQGLSVKEAFSAATTQRGEREGGLSAEDKRRVLGQATRMTDEAAAARAAAEAAAAAGPQPPGRGPAASTAGADGDPGIFGSYDDVYDDDVDDSVVVPAGLRVGAAHESDSETSDAGEDGEFESSDGDGDPRWRNNGKGGPKGGKGKGRGKGPVQGQTLAARRKEENKAKVANHNRRDQAMRKMKLSVH